MNQKHIIVLMGKGRSGKTSTLLKVFDRFCGHQEKTKGDIRETCMYREHEVFFATMGDSKNIVQENIKCMEKHTTWDIAVTASRTRGNTVKLLEDRFGKAIIPVWKKYGGDDESRQEETNCEDAEKILKMIDEIIDRKLPQE